MGTWGPGNFDSDNAADYLSEVIRGFVDTVEQLLARHPAFQRSMTELRSWGIRMLYERSAQPAIWMVSW